MKLLLFLLLIPCASALNCSGVDPGYFEDCEYIIYSGLSEDEQIYLIQCLFDLPQDFNLISEVKPKPLPDFIVKTNKQSYSSGELVVIEVKPENRLIPIQLLRRQEQSPNERDQDCQTNRDSHCLDY